MKNIKKFIVIGSGNSGAGGVHDYLLSRNDTQSPFNGCEFRLINDPNGLSDLHSSLYNNFSVNKSAEAMLNFKKFTERLVNSNYNKKHNLYKDKFIKISDEFLNKIKSLKYNGSPQFFFDKLSNTEKFLFYFKRLILRKKAREINLLNMCLPVTQENFYLCAQKYLENIFSSSSSYNNEKNIVINQGGSFWNPITSTKFYGTNTIPILVTRDPKGIFWSMKRRNSLSYPGHDLKIFVNWYKQIMKMLNKQELKEVIHIKYEVFFDNFHNEKIKLCKSLGISENMVDDFNLEHTRRNLFKYKKNLSTNEINYIDEHLKDYTQC